MRFIHDTLIVFRRQMRLACATPPGSSSALMQPILYLALFGPLLTRVAAGRAALRPARGAYKFFVPGLLIQLGLFGSTFVGFAIISDWRAGVIERFRVTPVSRLAIMTGRVLRDVVTLVVQAVDAGARRRGVRAARAAARRAARPRLHRRGRGRPGVGVVRRPALLVKSEDAFAPLLNSVVVPLVLLSGIMLPLTLGPGWLQGIGRISPFRYIIDAMRGAFSGSTPPRSCWRACWSRWAWRRCACGWGRASSSARTLRPGRPPGGQAPGPRRR